MPRKKSTHSLPDRCLRLRLILFRLIPGAGFTDLKLQRIRVFEIANKADAPTSAKKTFNNLSEEMGKSYKEGFVALTVIKRDFPAFYLQIKEAKNNTDFLDEIFNSPDKYNIVPKHRALVRRPHYSK